MYEKENCYNSKLAKEDVFKALDLYYNKRLSQTSIAKAFSVNKSTISKICRGKVWKKCYKEFIKERGI